MFSLVFLGAKKNLGREPILVETVVMILVLRMVELVICGDFVSY